MQHDNEVFSSSQNADPNSLDFALANEERDTSGSTDSSNSEHFAELVEVAKADAPKVKRKYDSLRKVPISPAAIDTFTDILTDMQDFLWSKFEKLPTYIARDEREEVIEHAVWIFAGDDKTSPFSFDTVAKCQGRCPDAIREGLGNEYPQLMDIAERYLAHVRKAEAKKRH